jgi:predicted kinase
MEAVIFIGLQGAGKSTFYKERFFDTHVRINLDMLRTRHRERVLIQACIVAQQSFVIDNTNPTVAERAVYISMAREAGFQIVGYFFQAPVEECVRRNQQRVGRAQVPAKAIYGTAKRLQAPTPDEGFDKLYAVRLETGGTFSVVALI